VSVVRPPQALLRGYNALLRRIRAVPPTSTIISLDFGLGKNPSAQDHGIEVIIDDGLPPSTPANWHGNVSVVVPLANLGFARREVERLLPLLRDRRYADCLGRTLLTSHLPLFAAWLARLPSGYPRGGVCHTAHKHFGLSLSSEPALLIFFAASAILEALGGVPRSAVDQYLDLRGRLVRTDYPIRITKCEGDPWLGDLNVAVSLCDLGLPDIDDGISDLLRRGNAFVDDLGDAMLQSHLNVFGDFVAELRDYRVVATQFRHRHWGMLSDGDEISFTLHLSEVRDALNADLSQMVAEGQRL
jgi:hypothetical protein